MILLGDTLGIFPKDHGKDHEDTEKSLDCHDGGQFSPLLNFLKVGIGGEGRDYLLWANNWESYLQGANKIASGTTR